MGKHLHPQHAVSTAAMLHSKFSYYISDKFLDIGSHCMRFLEMWVSLVAHFIFLLSSFSFSQPGWHFHWTLVYKTWSKPFEPWYRPLLQLFLFQQEAMPHQLGEGWKLRPSTIFWWQIHPEQGSMPSSGQSPADHETRVRHFYFSPWSRNSSLTFYGFARP